MNRVDSITLTFDGQTAVFDYSYDSVGRQTQSALTLNNVADRIVDTEYDYLGRAVSVRQHGTANSAIDDIMAELEYNANGLVTNVNRFQWDDTDEVYNLIAQSQYLYNVANQLTNITHKDALNNTLVSHGYTFDTSGNISQYANSIDGTVTYDYDFLGQLIGADYSALTITDESYSYDANGNRTMTGYVTDDNNELTSDGSWNYVYDAEGNRISKTNSTNRELYEWDYRNRLTRVTAQTYDSITESWTTVQIVEYAYDYNNVLIRKMIDTDGDGAMDSKTLFLPENYQTAVQLDDSDLSDSTDPTVSHRYLWTPQNQDKLIVDEQVTTSGSNVLWTLTDHLGTVRDIIQQTSTGIIQSAHIIYDAYGNVLSCKDSNGTDIASPVIFGFTGKYFDADTQLQNNVNRWYDATTGRWLSTDPIGFEGNDTNLYRYVENRVNQFIDFYGFKKTYIVFYINNSNTSPSIFRKDMITNSIESIFKKTNLEPLVIFTNKDQSFYENSNNLGFFEGICSCSYQYYINIDTKSELGTSRIYGQTTKGSFSSVINYKNIVATINENNGKINELTNAFTNIIIHETIWHGLLNNAFHQGDKGTLGSSEAVYSVVLDFGSYTAKINNKECK